MRADAQEFYDQLSHEILHVNDPTKRVHLRWLSFSVRNFYRDMVADVLARLPDDVKAEQPIRVLLAERAASHCDNTSYSTDYRCGALVALREVLESLAPQGLSVVE